MGVGLIYSGVRVPDWNADTKMFDTYESHVFVFTHECDVDQSNDRHFNESVIVCPITPINVLAETYAERGEEGAFFGMLPDIALDKVFRVFLLPPGMPGSLSLGGILELNALCSTHVSEFSENRVSSVCSLSEYGQRILDMKMSNHLLRPKSEQLPRLQ